MRKVTNAFTITFLLLCQVSVSAQQLQMMEDTDSLKARRQKTNANFQTLLDKMNATFSILSGKQDPITVQPPLSRSGNAISCPACLDANTSQTLTNKRFDLPILQGYPRSSIPTGSVGNLFFLNNDVGGLWLKGRAGKSYQVAGEEVNVEEYASIKAAIDEFNSLVGPIYRTLVIPNEQALPADLTVPDYVTLKLTGSGVINRNGHTLTINGTFQAPLRLAFKGGGSTKFGTNTSVVYPQWWGAKLDGARDDAAEIQAAIDSFPQTTKPHAGGEVHLTGGAVIGSTLTIQKNSVRLTGKGWGVSNESPSGGFIKWNGAAGLPMILIKNCWNSGVENVRLIGKSSARPSAAVEFKRENDATTQLNHSFLRRVWIGPYFGYDSDDATQFDVGILQSGSIDGDTNSFQEVVVNRAATGVYVSNGNASVSHFDTLKVTHCATGFRTDSFVLGTNWNFGANALDLRVEGDKRLYVTDFTTESAARFATVGTNGTLEIKQGGFQVTDSIDPSGIVIDSDAAGSRIIIEDSKFAVIAGYAGPVWKIRQRNTGGAGRFYLRLINNLGLSAENLDVQTAGEGPTSQHEVILQRPPFGSQDWGTHSHVYMTNGGAFEEGRNDFPGKVNVAGGPLTLTQLATPAAVTATPTGGGGTAYSYRVAAVSGSGETLASAAAACSNAATLGASVYNTITWDPVLGADGYKIYGRTAGSELLIGTVPASRIFRLADPSYVTSFKDDGSVTPSGAPPASNSTGSFAVEGEVAARGGQQINRKATAGNYTILPNDYLIAVTDTSGPRTITLPPAASVPNRVFHVIDESCGAAANNITVQRTGSDTFIDGGAASKVITTNCYVLTVYSTGSAWKVF
jgi:hypothetical protein